MYLFSIMVMKKSNAAINKSGIKFIKNLIKEIFIVSFINMKKEFIKVKQYAMEINFDIIIISLDLVPIIKKIIFINVFAVVLKNLFRVLPSALNTPPVLETSIWVHIANDKYFKQ